MILGFSSKWMVVVRSKQNIRPPSLAVGFLDGTGSRPAVVAAPAGVSGVGPAAPAPRSGCGLLLSDWLFVRVSP